MANRPIWNHTCCAQHGIQVAFQRLALCPRSLMSGSESEDFADLFGRETKASGRPAEKLVEYTLPSSGERLGVYVGNYLWNGAHWMSDYIDSHRDEFVGRSVVELGAGAGLPSLLATRFGAQPVICTDYPDSELIDNIEKNIQRFQLHQCHARGFLWGSPVQELLDLNKGRLFDVVIMCDVIFNHSEHRKLLRSVVELMSPQGVCWCVFSHYRPWMQEQDLALLQLARDEYSLSVTLVQQHQYDSIQNDFKDPRADPDVLRTVYAYQFRKILC